MPSPFPGMNPFIEQEDVWHDFHERFIPAAAESLLPQVLPNYIVKIVEHAYVHELAADERRLVGRPDAAIADQRATATADRDISLREAPVYGRIPTAVDVERQSYLEIRDRQSRQIVTVIELLSPSNKETDREQYLGKRDQFLRSPAHFIELDLLRGGPRLPVEGLPVCDYYAMVSWAGDRPRVGLWPFRLTDSLPVVPIPLRAPDVDVNLDLKQIIDRVYDAAGYRFYMYANEPQPPLSREQQAWTRQYLPQ